MLKAAVKEKQPIGQRLHIHKRRGSRALGARSRLIFRITNDICSSSIESSNSLISKNNEAASFARIFGTSVRIFWRCSVDELLTFSKIRFVSA